MPIHFNADEVFEMAEQIERNGAQFYRQAAEIAGEERTRRLFTQLALMEEDHLQTFSHLRAQLSEEERTPPTWDPEGEAALYLRAMADSSVFDVRADPQELLAGRKTVEEIIRVAIDLEKDSIDFYVGLKEATPQGRGGERVEGIIRQEMGHAATLRRELALLRHE